MEKALVVHNSLNPVGGGERVSLEFIRALKEMGYEVTLVTGERTDWERVRKLYPRAVMPDYSRNIIPFKVNKFAIYMKLLAGIGMIPEVRKGKYDITINTHGDMMPVPTDITYMHFPTFALLDEEYGSEKYRHGFWRLYFEPFRIAQSILAKRFKTGLILTNSRFSMDAIRKYVNASDNTVVEVVYPPVDVEAFLYRGGRREDIVVTCGRYSQEKRYELVVEIARRLVDVEFVVIGSTPGVAQKRYHRHLVNMAREKGVGNVHFLADVPRDEQVELYRRAGVYLHTMRNEHFGIAIVEAMASGLIPVVHKSGGAWTDIVEHGKYGYGYKTIDEAVENIRKALGDDKLRDTVIESSLRFSVNKFNERIKQIINNYTANEEEENSIG